MAGKRHYQSGKTLAKLCAMEEDGVPTEQLSSFFASHQSR